MFQTLKAQSGALGDMEYVIQSSLPAYDKVRGAKKQPACTRCKMKKLKCILDSDSDGCEKCLESGVTCSYGGSRRPASGSISSASGTSFASGGRSSSGPSSADSGGITQPGGGDVDSTIIISSVGSSKAVSPRDQLTQSTVGGGVSRKSPGTNSTGGADSTSNMSGSSSSEIHVNTSTCMTPMSQSIQDACHSASLDTVMDTPSFMADLTAGAQPSAAAAFTQAEMHVADRFPGDLLDADSLGVQAHDLDEFGICFCTDLVIAANATMQVRLVWTTWLNGGTTCTSSIEDILQCQKNVLASCDTFFQCRRCSLKPDYVVLVISMCREMVDGVRALQHITSPEVLRSRRRLQGNPLDHHHTNTGSGGSGNGKPRVEAGGWQLDDEDEIEIIRHLIQVRITKLRKLVGQVEQAVNADHASYGWMVGNLRKSLDQKLGSGSGQHVP